MKAILKIGARGMLPVGSQSGEALKKYQKSR